MSMIIRFLNWLREPWLTEARALAELRRRFTGKPRIVRGDGFVKIYDGRVLATNRPTLKRAMERVRRYCPIIEDR